MSTVRSAGAAALVGLTAAALLALGIARASRADGAPGDVGALVFVPAGWFFMGSQDQPIAGEGEGPGRWVYLDAYWIDRFEVTNGQFGRFVQIAGHVSQAERDGHSRGFIGGNFVADIPGANWRAPLGPSERVEWRLDQPVIVMSWGDADAYCRWAGMRLPSEAEWEKAARGDDRRSYPWGNAPPSGDLANLADVNNRLIPWAEVGIDDGHERASPVGAYPRGASPYGALDMAGNAAEWVGDWFASYGVNPVAWNPVGPADGTHRVLRGGSYNDNSSKIRATRRTGDLPTYHSGDTGFRCAADGHGAFLPRLERGSVLRMVNPTPTSTPTRTTTPTPTPDGRPDACDRALGQSYKALSVTHLVDKAPQDDPEVNLDLRGWSAVDEHLGLVKLCGPTDSDAPRLGDLFGDHRLPQFTSTHVMFKIGGRASGQLERYPWRVQLAGLASQPGETIHLPGRAKDIDSGAFHAVLLFADENSATFKYTRDDAIRGDVNGYAVHMENVCVAPELLTMYRDLRRTFAARSELPAISGSQPVARALGNQMLIAVRDTGSFMDPRSGKDWWPEFWREEPCGQWDFQREILRMNGR